MPLVPLPIDDALPRLVAALRAGSCAVLRAPPGAGKTTRVPPALLDAGLAGDGRVVVLEPRRVAARAAARRIAWERGGNVGDEVGWHVRFDRNVGPRTRIIVVSEGIFLRKLQDDPFLDGVGAVVFDEFHERSLTGDLSLAMTRRVQQSGRDDLRIVVMSATLDTARAPGPQPNRIFAPSEDPQREARGNIAAYLDAPVVESSGFLHPVEVRHLDQQDTRRLADVAVDGVKRALAGTAGDVLVFLPGVGEIRAVLGRLGDVARQMNTDIVELFGDLPAERQDAALQRGARRRVVLATNVAETSVTVEGVTAVVDTGWARVLRHDPAVGMDRLVLARIARSSIDQRTGRAGRTAPGVCFRLWTRNEERSFPERLEPEVRRVDLAGAVLELLAWGETDVAAFPWFEAPEPARLASALDLLRRLGAVDEGGHVTETGHAMVRVPVHPRLARMLVEGHRLGHPERAALAAALLSERDPILSATRPRRAVHHSDADVLDRLDALERFARHGHRHFDFGELHVAGANFVLRASEQLERTAHDALGATPPATTSSDVAVLRALLAGFPDRLARRRGEGDRRAVLVTGQGVRLADESAVADAELFVCVDVDAGHGPEALVRSASLVRRAWLPPDRVTTQVDIEFDESASRVVAMRRTRFDALVLDENPAALSDAGADCDDRAAALLAEAAARDLPHALDLASQEIVGLRTRIAFLSERMPDLGLAPVDDDVLRAALPDLCAGRRSFEELLRAPLADVLRARLDRRQLAALGREAPERLTVPSGSHVPLRYEAGRPPVLAVRIQEIFGWADTPRIAGGRVPVVLELLAPNHRPQQVTDDLRSFWTNTYPGVRNELKRRYPRHSWPEDPWTAQAEHRPKRRRTSR